MILKAAAAADYAPTHAARMLKSKRSNKILFCIPDIYNPFYFGMIRGASDVLEKHGYFTVLCHTRHSISEELRLIQALRERYGDVAYLGEVPKTVRVGEAKAGGRPLVHAHPLSSAATAYRAMAQRLAERITG